MYGETKRTFETYFVSIRSKYLELREAKNSKI